MFALFVGIANACCWDGVTAVPHQPTVAAHAVDDAMDHGMASDCEECCSNDVPLLSVLKLVQEQPAGQPLVIATHYDLGFLWFVMNMFSIRMFSFVSSIVITAIIAAGLAMIVNPPHKAHAEKPAAIPQKSEPPLESQEGS